MFQRISTYFFQLYFSTISTYFLDERRWNIVEKQIFQRILFQRIWVSTYFNNFISTYFKHISTKYFNVFQRISTSYFNVFARWKTLKYEKRFNRLSTIFKLQGSLMLSPPQSRSCATLESTLSPAAHTPLAEAARVSLPASRFQCRYCMRMCRYCMYEQVFWG
jgi:hypothetical protein